MRHQQLQRLAGRTGSERLASLSWPSDHTSERCDYSLTKAPACDHCRLHLRASAARLKLAFAFGIFYEVKWLLSLSDDNRSHSVLFMGLIADRLTEQVDEAKYTDWLMQSEFRSERGDGANLV